jgi:hypothetical protein
MYFNKLVPALAVAIGATQAAAYRHGEVAEVSGKTFRWQQLAEGVFTGVPIDEWDDNGKTLTPSSLPAMCSVLTLCALSERDERQGVGH